MADVFAGRFELIDPIGSGGTGTVWRAWDRRLERFCAAKVLRQRHAGALLRFVREQGLRLDHPNILSPYSWAADDDQALLAMDLVGGGAVSNLLADFGGLPDRYAAELLAQLLGALVQVHAAGLVHRDIKPANLLLEATGTQPPVLRLSDFGIALSLGEPRLTHQGALIGTPGYLAPETLAGEPPAVAQDLYAAGVTAWQLLTGQEPPTTHPLPAPTVPTPLWQVIKPLLAADPADRPSAESALAALAPVLSQPLETPARTPDEEPIEVFDQLPPIPAGYQQLTAPTPAEADAEPRPETPTGTDAHRGAGALGADVHRGAGALGADVHRLAGAPGADAGPRAGVLGVDAHPGGGGPSASARPSAGALGVDAHPGGGGPGPSAHPSAGAPGADADPAAGAPRGDAQPGTSYESVAGSPEGTAAGTGVGSDAGDHPGSGARRAEAGRVVAAGVGARGAARGGAASSWGRRRVLVGVVGALVVAGVGAGLLLEGRPDRGTPSSGESSAGPSPTPSRTASETPPVVPTGPVTRVPNAAVTLGGACGWQEAGSQETTADGTRVECRQQGSAYRWIRA
ncbi:protein kinase domain-containing protein [Kribbella sp. DT2]|uniref:serine/threonine-protein kinase n=1 Tax=Kribbella sp. DT2 TaxID=3393427 RepID=UPI003CE84EAF